MDVCSDLLEHTSNEFFRCVLSIECDCSLDILEQIKIYITNINGLLSEEDRILMSLGFKNITSTKRNTLSKLKYYTSLFSRDTDKIIIIKEYYKKIFDELRELCEDLIEIINQHIASSNIESELRNIPEEKRCIYLSFFYKMIADYYRYICEYITDDNIMLKNKYVDKCRNYYSMSYEISLSLNSASESRLGIIMNYSVFICEIVGYVQTAIDLATVAYNDAKEDILKLTDSKEKERSLICLKQIEENINIWKNIKDQ